MRQIPEVAREAEVDWGSAWVVMAGERRLILFYGGIFPTLVFDNLTVAVRQILRGKGRVEQKRFRGPLSCKIEAREMSAMACP